MPAVTLALLLLVGCAHALPAPRCVPQPSNFAVCADACAAKDAGDPLIWENAKEVMCMCRKPPVGT